MAKLTFNELEQLAAELGSLIRAGVPLPEGLRQLEQSVHSGRVKKLAGALAAEVERGLPLSEALLTAKVSAPPEFAALARCGEISGNLQGALDFTVDHARRVSRHRSALATALIYPLFVVLFLLLSITFLLIFIIPRFRDIYDQLGSELPWPTQQLVNLSGYSGLIVLMILALAAIALSCVFSNRFRDFLYKLTGRLPGFSILAALSDTAVFTKFIGGMMGRGVPLPDTCRAASLLVWQKENRIALNAMGDAAEEGHPVAPHMGSKVPATAAWLFHQGEQRGDLPAACEGISGYCEDRFERLSQRAVLVLEPTLLLLIAIAVGMTVIALYLPLFNIPKIVGKN